MLRIDEDYEGRRRIVENMLPGQLNKMFMNTVKDDVNKLGMRVKFQSSLIAD